MKKVHDLFNKTIVIALIGAVVMLQGCGNTTNTTESTLIPEVTTASTPEVTPYEETDIIDEDIDETDEESTPKPTAKPIKGTKLFEQIYVPFASREKGSAFISVKSLVEASNFKCKVTKPTSSVVGEIKVSAKNGDYVYFAFKPSNDLDVIMTVSYYQKGSKREVSLNNYSSDNSFEHDKLTTHKIGKSQKEVSSIKKQREFLFSNK